MSITGYIVRDAAGNLQQGNFAEGSPSTIYVSHSKDISLNLSAAEVQGYERHGQDLHVILQGGEVLVLNGYFNESTTGGKNLFLSQEGEMVEVILEDRADGYLAAGYEPLDTTGKWSSYDELVFLDVSRIEPTVAPLAAAGAGGFGAAGAAAAGGAALLAGGGGSGGGGGGGGSVITPTVDDADLDRIIGGTGDDTVVVTGTGSAGSTVEVAIGTETQTVIIGDDGTWTASFDPADLPSDGIYTSTVNVVDLDGNTWDLTGPLVDIDTTAPEVTVTEGTVSVGEIINAVEHSSGTVITGTGEAGATVDVEINGTVHSTTVANDGSWTVTFASGEIATGEYSTTVTLTTTDTRGNSRTSTDMLEVDTIAPPVAMGVVETDDIINAAERSDGVTLSGTGEAGTTVTVEFQGITRTATVAANGSWSVAYDASEITEGTYNTTVTITAEDAAGNTTTLTEAVMVDTEVGTPEINSVNFVGDDVYQIGTDANGGTITVNALHDNGAVTTPTATQSADAVLGSVFTFSPMVSDGTHLMVTSSDTSGNSSSTMLVLDDDAGNAETLNHAGTGQFDIDSLNLDYAANVDLVLDEDTIKDLSVNSDTLTINGGRDDIVTVSGATSAGQQVIDGQIYDVYTVGSDATLLVEEDVTVNII